MARPACIAAILTHRSISCGVVAFDALTPARPKSCLPSLAAVSFGVTRLAGAASNPCLRSVFQCQSAFVEWAAKAMEASGQDPTGLDAKHDSAVAESHLPETQEHQAND